MLAKVKFFFFLSATIHLYNLIYYNLREPKETVVGVNECTDSTRSRKYYGIIFKFFSPPTGKVKLIDAAQIKKVLQRNMKGSAFTELE